MQPGAHSRAGTLGAAGAAVQSSTPRSWPPSRDTLTHGWVGGGCSQRRREATARASSAAARRTWLVTACQQGLEAIPAGGVGARGGWAASRRRDLVALSALGVWGRMGQGGTEGWSCRLARGGATAMMGPSHLGASGATVRAGHLCCTCATRWQASGEGQGYTVTCGGKVANGAAST